MNYDDIPTYTAARIDPDDPEPTGQFDLRDCLDFRPTVADITGSSTTVTATDTITGNSFDLPQGLLVEQVRLWLTHLNQIVLLTTTLNFILVKLQQYS